MNYVYNVRKAMNWIVNNSNGEYVHISNKQKIPYPEVTGYFIPTLKKIGFKTMSYNFAKYLINNQNKDGGWGLKNKSFIFDTAQVIEGLSEFDNEFRNNINKAINFIENNIDNNKFIDQYNGKISDHIYPRVLWGLKKVGYNTSKLEKRYCIKKNRLFDCLSHFYGYSFEGHVRLGYDCNDFINVIKKYNLILPEKNNLNSFCFTGLSQIALCLFLCKKFDMGINVLNKVTLFQNESGGFLGSNGKYFPNEEISWATKFYLDACFEASKLWFDINKNIFKNNFEDGIHDERLEFIKNNIENDDIVLDIGAGKGRYIKNIKCKKKYASDIVETIIAKEDNNISFIEGSCLDIPYKDNFVTKIICAESLEHVVFFKKAINEMMRVIKPGGKLLIIDKDGEKMNSIKLHFMEEWPDFKKILNNYKYKKYRLKIKNKKMPFVGIIIYV